MLESVNSPSVIIMGCGRSGTSLLAGSIAGNFQFLGNLPFRSGSESNPKGFFEDVEINYLNDRIIEASGVKLPAEPDERRSKPYGGWLAVADSDICWTAPPECAERIRLLSSQGRYMFKDPRFSYTFPFWRSHSLHSAVYLAVFREPGKTATSMTKEYLALKLGLTFTEALTVWEAMYRNILSHAGEDTCFLHFDQILSGEADAVLRKLGVGFDRSFPDSRLRRSPDAEVPERFGALYQTLLAKCGWGR